MGSINQSPDRIAQVLSGSAAQQGGDSAVQPADSNPVQVVEQAFTGVSAAEIVYESKQQHSSVSEGVASAGHPPQLSIDRMDEFVPAGAVEAPVSAGIAQFEGETSGGNELDVTGGSNGYGELAETGDQHLAVPMQLAPQQRIPPASPMDYQTNASALVVGPSPTGKRKSSCEVSDFLDPKRPEAGPLNRVPSDLAMVTGLSDGEGGDLVGAFPQRRAMDASDSNIAGILAGVAAAPTVNDGDTAQAMFMPPLPGTTTTIDANNNNNPNINAPFQQQQVNQPNQQQQQPRPTDADIIAWENQIREEEVRNVPLVGEMEDLEALEAEYRAGSDIFRAKIVALRRSYQAIRRTRGDGNCFFRSFIFGYLENILRTGDLAERDRAVVRLNGLKQSLINAGYQELVLESPLELLLGMLHSIGSATDPLTMEALESNMRAEDISNYVVFLLRMATSAEIKRRSDFFAPFILGLSDMDVETFCQMCVDPMGEESDHVQMVALTDALKVPVRVVYLDRSLAPGGGGGGASGGDEMGIEGHESAQGVSFGSVAPGGAASTAGTLVSVAIGGPMSVKVDVHDFLPEDLEGSPEARVHLLYRPGHYDLLYPRV